MYGYHNIEPQPIKLYAPFVENPVNKNANKLRDMMVGFGFIEVLTYGFIPGNSMQMLHIKEGSEYYGDIKILNPLNNFYELMRPSLAYGLISTAIANMSVGKNDLRIFEVGKRFFRQKDHEDGYNEKNVFAALMTGVKLGRGFGIAKDAKFSVYDAVSLLDALLREYNIKYEIKQTDELGMFEAGAGGDIYVCGRRIGYLGKIDPKVLGEFENGKLARDDVAYLEFCFEGFDETKRCIEFDSMYPSVTREYNFLVKNGIHFTDYAPVIKEASGIIVNVSPRDVYTGAGVPKGYTSVLIRIEYNDPTRTLDLEEISGVEAVFMKALADKFGIALKL
jgi:phenylalanyl-tRNA synthetase beta chain